MAEKCWIKISTKTASLAKLYPFGKVLWTDFITIDPLAGLKNGIAGVNIYLLFTGNGTTDSLLLLLSVCSAFALAYLFLPVRLLFRRKH